MRRCLFTFAAVVSLLLCIATAALWFESYFGPTVGEQLLIYKPKFRVMLERGGDLAIVYWSSGQVWWAESVEFPLWPIALATAVIPLMRVILKKKRRDALCLCGYNLTGNTSGVCPECGTKTENQSVKISN